MLPRGDPLIRVSKFTNPKSLTKHCTRGICGRVGGSGDNA